ncbi:MAG: sulfatase-like hydrolase/transferase [Planctomycetaceae bacterium]
MKPAIVARVVGIWAALLLAPAAAHAIAADRPNVIVFLVDDLGVMDTSVPFLTDPDGRPRRHPLNDFYHTPAMERLAASGARFSTFYAMSVCSPTRISLMTGQNAARHRTTNWINWRQDNAGPLGPPDWNWRGLDADDVTLPRLLRQAGYRTIHVGKGHFAPRGAPGEDPAALGFDVNIAGSCIGAPATYFGSRDFARRDTPSRARAAADNAVPGLEHHHGEDIFLTEALTREATAEITAAVGARQPFFLHLAHYAVHAPFESDPRFADRYADRDVSPPARAFATLVEGMDRSLGDILDHLQALGVAADTRVLFLGDNGSDAPLGHEHAWASAAPLRGRKGSHYEGGMRVPFIASWAAPDPTGRWQRRLPIAAGAIQRQIANVCDVMPTILRLDDVPVPPGHVVDGRPLDLLLAGRDDPAHERTFLMHYPHAPHRSDYVTVWREGDWKVIYHHPPAPASGGARYQLFNLHDDPFEEHDLAGERPGELARMMQGLVQACDAHAALQPLDPDTRRPRRPVVPAAPP